MFDCEPSKYNNYGSFRLDKPCCRTHSRLSVEIANFLSLQKSNCLLHATTLNVASLNGLSLLTSCQDFAKSSVTLKISSRYT